MFKNTTDFTVLSVPPKYYIGNIGISITNPDLAEDLIEKLCLNRTEAYVSIGNMRTTVYANQHEDYHEVIEHSIMNLPDGMPLVWCVYNHNMFY